MSNTPTRGFSRATVATALASIALSVAAGTAAADVDATANIVDQHSRTVNAIESDTQINFVPPLDGSPLTREWFHSGTASYHIDGPDADNWHGHITMGYEVGYLATLDGKLRFSYSTPGLNIGPTWGTGEFGPTFTDLIPQAGIDISVGFGPGIQTIEATGGDVSGADGFLRMQGFHGTVTGVLGPTHIRPFVRIVSAEGDTVVTYGQPWTI
ncbi:MspA family porin [Nocardia stercoris]|uniref:Porin n=1 Tax=Nocardia stercoris TaxID=2483361 RepID=A0A3M2L490_9NOCA|nr:MspA family porin [Nocardia stercoris]RMI32194.1 porin [Nocardia stercoris]